MQALLQESLATAMRSGRRSLARSHEVVVDTTVQEKNIAQPSDAKLIC